MSMQLGNATVAQGTISGDVKTIQQILTGQGYNVGPLDGNFGPLTAEAVRAFQRTKGLQPDGVVGPQTWNALSGKVPDMPVAPAVSVAPDNSKLLMVGFGFAVLGFVLTVKQ